MAVLKHYSVDRPMSLSDIVTLEIDMRWSREAGTMAPHENVIPMGAVLALDGEGKYVPYMTELPPENSGDAPVIADQAIAVLISKDLPASDDDQPCTVIRRGACVAVANLPWPDGVTDAQKKTALGQLSALGIVPKE